MKCRVFDFTGSHTQECCLTSNDTVQEHTFQLNVAASALLGFAMKQHNALALLALLCLSFTFQTLANNSTKAASRAKLTQGPADGYAGREQYPPHVLKQPYGGPKESPEQPYAYEEDFNEEPKCPDPQPADSVKDGTQDSLAVVLCCHGNSSFSCLLCCTPGSTHLSEE